MRPFIQYLVIRRRRILGYEAFFGPMVSTPYDVRRDAERLYGKKDHDIAWVAWSKASKWQKQQARDNLENV